jgi:hypothetical protein
MTQQLNTRPRISADLEEVTVLPGRWRNFRGLKTEMNAEGNRNFNVVLSPEQAARMRLDGWRVKEKAPYTPQGELPDEGAEPDFYLNVKVGYKFAPPSIFTITTVKTPIGEGLVGTLDDLRILTADIQISGRWSDMAGGGYTAYLRKGFFVVEQDNLDKKWDLVPTAGAASGEGGTNEESEEDWR